MEIEAPTLWPEARDEAFVYIRQVPQPGVQAYLSNHARNVYVTSVYFIDKT